MMVARYAPVDSTSTSKWKTHSMNTKPSSIQSLPGRSIRFSDPFHGPMANAHSNVLSKLHAVPNPSATSHSVTSKNVNEGVLSEGEMSPPASSPSYGASRASSSSSASDSSSEHVLHLSSLEQCMPRAYIRVCLAYAMPDASKLPDAINKLRDFVRRTVDAKPYLAGYVTLRKNSSRHVGQVEVRFTTQDFLDYPGVEVKRLEDESGNLVSYRELDEQGLPPSRLRPEEVSMLPPDVVDFDRAPVLRIQANVIEGGLIVSFYLHHCISDGKGLGLMISGDVLDDDFTFQRHLDSHLHIVPSLESRLHAFAKQKSAVRQKLSWSDPNQVNTRDLRYKSIGGEPAPKNNPGRGSIMVMPRNRLTSLQLKLQEPDPAADLSFQCVIMALLWRHMTRARRPSVSHNVTLTTSNLLIPVDIRNKMKEKLSNSYFGAAVDFAKVEMDLDSLVLDDEDSLLDMAKNIRDAIAKVDESYIRQAIALAQSSDARVDVRDLQASNMDRVNGADMYITSWYRLPLYDSDLGMGLGKPDWVRKPWSRDPGSCIILPSKEPNPENVEVVVQMTETDLSRLLEDDVFMGFVSRVID